MGEEVGEAAQDLQSRGAPLPEEGRAEQLDGEPGFRGDCGTDTG